MSNAKSKPIGTGNYHVRQGDCLISIAERTGHFWQTIWTDPNNAEVRGARGDPGVLMPGDCIFIPEIRLREEAAVTDQLHRFVRKGVPARLRIQFLRDGEPRSSVPYLLVVEGLLDHGSTDGEGFVDVPIPPGATKGTITVGEGADAEKYDLDLGELDPPESIAGAQARLHNLGFSPGPVNGTMNENTTCAIRAFQKAYGLEETAELDAAAIEKLKTLHGS